MFGPYFLAFPDSYTTSWVIFDYIVNIFFGIDILVNFFCAFYSEDYNIIDDYQVFILNLFF
jgi:hypothetical protein